MQEIKIKIVDWWDNNIENNFIINFLKKKYKVTISDNPDYILFSVFGKEHLKYNNCIKIFYTGENISAD
ncbi:TPA: alpha-1,3-fucosyltransferase, partial [Campylobacter lari]|nr:alpha-1,3-fucosyltransferase [Campylobacter lari]